MEESSNGGCIEYTLEAACKQCVGGNLVKSDQIDEKTPDKLLGSGEAIAVYSGEPKPFS